MNAGRSGSSGDTPAIAVPTGRAIASPPGPTTAVAMGLLAATPPSPTTNEYWNKFVSTVLNRY